MDPGNFTCRVLAGFREADLPVGCEIDVLLSGRAPWLDEVLVLASGMSILTRVLIDVQNVSELMVASDLP